MREAVSGTGGQNRTSQWVYDRVGNRLTHSNNGTINNSATYTYDANDRLSSESGFTYIYDNNGNLTAKKQGTTTVGSYRWDEENRMVGAVIDAKMISYTYDPNGIRRAQEEASGTMRKRTEYLVDPNQAYAQVLEEWNTNGAATGALPDEALAKTYVFGDDLISQTVVTLDGAATNSFYHYDGLGTTRALSNSAGVVTDRNSYTAFGENDPAGTSGNTAGVTSNNFKYTGEQLDANLGFYYLRARYMSPSVGGFMGMDIFEGERFNPMSFHKYTYAHNSPTMGIDPTGMMNLVELMTGVNIRVGGQQMTLQGLRNTVKTVVSQTIKTFGSAKDKVRKCLRSTKTCDLNFPVFVVGGDLPELADHILDAQMGMGTNYLPPGFLFSFKARTSDRSWYNKTFECSVLKRKMAGPGKDCDEFPMFTMNRGGSENHPTFVSLRLINGGQNRTGGAIWGTLAGIAGMKTDPRIRALVIAWKEIPMTVALPLNKL